MPNYGVDMKAGTNEVLTDWFFFGTLRDIDVLSAVVNRQILPHELQAAYLLGFDVLYVENELYPALVKSSAANRVEGVFIRKLKAEESERIQYFEGDQYQPETKLIYTQDGGTYHAGLFMLCEHVKTQSYRWELSDWAFHYKTPYLIEAQQWMLGFKSKQ